jgi:hypothetical protein
MSMIIVLLIATCAATIMFGQVRIKEKISITPKRNTATTGSGDETGGHTGGTVFSGFVMPK